MIPETGGAIQVTVEPDTGTPWVRNTAGTVFRLVSGVWTAMNSGTGDPHNDLTWLAAGPSATAWAMSNTNYPGSSYDKTIYHYSGGTWTQISGVAGIEIAVTPSGIPWMFNHNGTLFQGRLSGSTWTFVAVTGVNSNQTQFVSAGANNQIWIIDATTCSGCASGDHQPLYMSFLNNTVGGPYWDGGTSDTTWTIAPSGGLAVSVTPVTTTDAGYGTSIAAPWLLNSAGQVFVGVP